LIAAAALSRRVRGLELRARKNVGHIGEGAYRTAFKGSGVEFQEIREYAPGDDIRTIDWNVTARHGRPYVKRFATEREQTILLVVDGSASTRFGTAEGASKRDLIAEVAATLAYAAVQNEDRVGLILFGNEVEAYVPPGRGVQHALRIMRDVLQFTPRLPGTDLAKALEFLDRVTPRRVFAFLISDFMAADASRQLRLSGKRHNLVALVVNDRAEAELPDCGLVEFEEPESGERLTLDTSDREVRAAFAGSWKSREMHLLAGARAADVDHFAITAGDDYFPDLLRVLRTHATRR
jgi:uncharacterized protein (DUF58 family)